MTADTLKAYTCKELATLAKRRGVPGWHAMRKDQLVRALLRTSAASKPSNGHAARPQRRAHSSSQRVAARKAKNPRAARRLVNLHQRHERLKNLAGRNGAGAALKDRLVLMVRDPYWLHANWELMRRSVDRASAAMGQDWHTAKPVLRLYEVAGGAASTVGKPVRDIEIHGGVNNWYVDVQDPPKSYRAEIGYLAASGKYFSLVRSNVVTTPKAGAKDDLDQHWEDVAQDYERIYAQSGGHEQEGSELRELFEERLRRPMSNPVINGSHGMMDGVLPRRRNFSFAIDAEMILYGATEPDAKVTLQGDPVKLREDGSFTVRLSMPNARQVLPITAWSADGLEQQTIVLAVERNTKVMEPVTRETGDP